MGAGDLPKVTAREKGRARGEVSYARLTCLSPAVPGILLERRIRSTVSLSDTEGQRLIVWVC